MADGRRVRWETVMESVRVSRRVSRPDVDCGDEERAELLNSIRRADQRDLAAWVFGLLGRNPHPKLAAGLREVWQERAEGCGPRDIAAVERRWAALQHP
jgi:hypothetical protein